MERCVDRVVLLEQRERSAGRLGGRLDHDLDLAEAQMLIRH